MSNTNAKVLRAQMLEDRIQTVSEAQEIDQDQAFMRVVYALLFNTTYSDPAYDEDVVDGGDDKQIDIIRIEQNEDQATIHVVQVKNNIKYQTNTLVQMKDGLQWLLEWPKEQYTKIPNNDLVSKISNIRQISGTLGLKNLDVIVHYVAKGDTSTIHPSFRNEVSHIIDIYRSSDDFRNFDFNIWGLDELINKSYEVEKSSVKIDADIPIYYFRNVCTYTEYKTGPIKAVICTVSGSDLANLVNKHQSQIFEENVRTYLGTRKRVNTQIYQTCTDDDLADFFWFYNNGVTVTCNDFDVMWNVEPAFIRINNMQIVNGCQTSMTLAEAQRKGVLSEKTRVLLKVFASRETEFIDKITLTTNSQNAVSSRDLRSNDMAQRHIEDLLGSRGYFYERKPRSFMNLSKKDQKKIISNEKLGQAYLAIVLHRPAVAMSQPSKIWAEYYDKIYQDQVERLLLSYLIYEYCVQKRKNIRKENLSNMDDAVLKYGTFHLCRIIGSYLLGNDWLSRSTDDLRNTIDAVSSNSNYLDNVYDKARALLLGVVQSSAGTEVTSLINIFKSQSIEDKLDEALET